MPLRSWKRKKKATHRTPVRAIATIRSADYIGTGRRGFVTGPVSDEEEGVEVGGICRPDPNVSGWRQQRAGTGAGAQRFRS
jgi:hypothetical protein